MFEAVSEIFRHIKQSANHLTKQSTKKALSDKISMRILELEFKSKNMTKPKPIKYIVKKNIK